MLKLYDKTIDRQHNIIDMGYNLIVIWESEWIRLNKAIILLQNIFRNFKF
jgi:hypothetical protein